MRRHFLNLALAFIALAFCVSKGYTDPLNPKQRADLLSHVAIRHVHADTDGDGIFDDLGVALAEARPAAVHEVIVRFKPGRETAAAPYADRITRVLKSDNSVVAPLTGAEIRALADSGAIASIEEDAVELVHRDTSQASFGVTKLRQDFGYRGTGVTIAVVDTGVDPNHPSFAGDKILFYRDMVNNRTTAYDDVGHGTHVASIALGGDTTGGVAPAARLVMVKTTDANGSSLVSRTAASIDWCVENRQQYNIKVINISIGGSTPSDGTDAHSRAADRAVAAGIVVVEAAGNGGTLPYSTGTGAAAANVITVGNFYDTGKNGFALAASSSRGPTADGRPKPDVCAPGVSILAAQAGTQGYVRLTGSSMAAPFVAGVAALMLEANPGLTPAQVKDIVKSTAIPWGPHYTFGPTANFGGATGNNLCGAGRLDAYAAVARAGSRTGTPPAGPSHLSGGGFLSGINATQTWSIPIDNTQYPIAITLHLDDANVDFDMFLFSRTGSTVGSSVSGSRQETILLNPANSGTGNYTLVVISYYGSGTYWLDVSAGSSLK